MRLPRSIHGRMLALSAATTLIALPVSGFAIGGVLEHFVTRNIDARLSDKLRLLNAVVRPDGEVDGILLGRVSVATGFSADAVWRIDAPGGAIGGATLPGYVVRSDVDGVMPLGPVHPHPQRRPDEDGGAQPFEARLVEGTRVHGLTVAIASTTGPVRLSVAVPRWQIEQPLRLAMLPLLATLAIVALLLAAATLVQLRYGLRPLRALRDRVAAVRSGGAADVPEDQPDELRPLAAELNALLRDNATALAAARASAANLAHALKTPVATLALDLAGDPRGRQVARIDATIRHHLSRARGHMVDRRAATPIGPAIAALAAAVATLHRATGIRIDADAPGDPTAAIDPADFDELVGNLLDNAARHARSGVSVNAVRDGATVVLRVADDGPGIPAADRVRATDPGIRLDERGDGHGFGLAIVRDLAALYGGALTLGEAAGGGLVARVTLPLALSPAGRSGS